MEVGFQDPGLFPGELHPRPIPECHLLRDELNRSARSWGAGSDRCRLPAQKGPFEYCSPQRPCFAAPSGLKVRLPGRHAHLHAGRPAGGKHQFL